MRIRASSGDDDALESVYRLIVATLAIWAQPTVAPTDEPVGIARGEDASGYNVRQSFELGYRYHTRRRRRGHISQHGELWQWHPFAGEFAFSAIARWTWTLVRSNSAQHARAGQRSRIKTRFSVWRKIVSTATT